MPADPSIWNHSPVNHRSLDLRAIAPKPYHDPIKIWTDFLMNHGGYVTLLGAPAAVAFLAFIGRIRWLKRHRSPHDYGRTGWIYWPSQAFIALACLILLFSLLTSFGSSMPADGFSTGVALMLLAWLAALPLNALEHRYGTRSSDFLFGFYLVTLTVGAISAFILSDERDDRDDHEEPTYSRRFWHVCYFGASIAIAFFFEAFPRTNTRVQRLHREKENLSRYQQANLFSRLSYHYFQEIVSLGAKRPLTGDDLANTTPRWLLTHVNYELLAATWEENRARAALKNREPSLFWTVLYAYRRTTAVVLVIRLVGYTFLYIPPMLFGQLLQFIGEYSNAVRDGLEPPPLKTGFMIASLMMIFNITTTFVLCYTFQVVADLGYQARAATIALVYRKSLKLSPAARNKSTVGEITNHMAIDAEKWVDGSTFIPMLITVPFELVIAVYLLYGLLGWSLVAGLAVFAILIPIQTKMAGFLNGYQDDQLKWMDSRLRLMTEILTNIKIVKLYNWEQPFRKKIDALRTKEMQALKGLATVRSLLTIVFSSVTLLMALVTFWVYAYIGGPNWTPGKLTSEIVFVSIALFGIMNRPLGLVAHIVSTTIAVTVAMKRVDKFLMMEEIDTTVVQRYCRQPQNPTSGHNGSKVLAVDIQQGTFAWEKQQEAVVSNTTSSLGERQPLLAATEPSPVKPTLSNITLRVPDGHLTAIAGRIGQGKSSLLSAIMGEMYKLNGTVAVYGDLAYVPQQAWIINATVRDNILFGKPYDQKKYDSIIYASGLQPDLEMLTAGDMTEIGERGINLSGGQKQRVSLARAAYQDADIYLLDDPLSAVDAHVDQHLWTHLIGPDGLLKDKTRLLVTHGIHHLENVDQIVVLKDGTISETGEYQQLMKARGAFYQLINDYSVSKKKKKSHSSKNRLRNLLAGEKDKTSSSDTVASANSSTHNSDSDGETSERNTVVGEVASKGGDKAASGDDDDDDGELIADEKMEEGKVGWRIVMIYAKAASYRNAMICLILFVLAQSCHISTNFWLRHWITDLEERERDGQEGRPTSYYLAGYGMLVVLYMCFDVIVNYTTEVVCGIRASNVLYDRLLTRVLRLPMSFFDTTPMGRIVNRFSSDMNAIDTQLPEEWNDLFAFTSIIGGTLIVIAYSTPAFLIAVPPLAFTYICVQNYFIKSSGSIKRLISVSRSPLYQHFSETLTGLSTIRVMKGLKDQFIRENEVRGDVISTRLNAFNLDNRWLQIRLEVLGGMTIFISASLAVLNAGRLDPSIVGLALSYALNMIGMIGWLVRTYSQVQCVLVSVERVDEYSEKPTEAPAETGVRLPPNWPDQGHVVFRNYSARYREGLDLVVKNVSFTVQPSEKVGIVGRTGAGKSSLTLALFRIIEAADSYWAKASDPSFSDKNQSEDAMALYSEINGGGGSIEIDGIDISTLGLDALRQHLSIIPQDPTLFAGTIRHNLDPFETQSDKELWEALERAHLKDHISTLPGGLSFEVAQNGENFSVGQRALICLARALLRKTKVLILDEATAAVDVETDDLIQKTLRREFKDRTVLTIAHRIKTVMDSDKILVLEKGRVQEFDAPKVLLQKHDSLFYQLADQAGEVDGHEHARKP